MEIIFYSTHCPKCKVIETKLKQAGLKYTEVDDVDEMIKLGFRVAPVLKVDDRVLNFAEANKFLNEVRLNGIN